MNLKKKEDSLSIRNQGKLFKGRSENQIWRAVEQNNNLKKRKMKTYESGDDGEGWSSNILFVCLFVCRECQAKLKAEFCGRENGPSQCLKDQAKGKYSLMVVTGEECMCFVFLSYFLQRCLFLIDITSLLLILSEGDTANPNQISSQ